MGLILNWYNFIFIKWLIGLLVVWNLKLNEVYVNYFEN